MSAASIGGNGNTSTGAGAYQWKEGPANPRIHSDWRNAQAGGEVTGFKGPLENRAKVAVVECQIVKGRCHRWPMQRGLRMLHQLDKVCSVRVARLGELVGKLKLVDGVIANGLQKPEPRLGGSIVANSDQALGNQLGQDFEGVSFRETSSKVAAHALSGRGSKATKEDATPSKHRLVHGLEEVVTPGDGSLDGLVADGQIAMHRPDERGTGCQPRQDDRRRNNTDLSSSELDSQRQTVQARTDLGDRRECLVGELESYPSGPRPFFKKASPTEPGVSPDCWPIDLGQALGVARPDTHAPIEGPRLRDW